MTLASDGVTPASLAEVKRTPGPQGAALCSPVAAYAVGGTAADRALTQLAPPFAAAAAVAPAPATGDGWTGGASAPVCGPMPDWWTAAAKGASAHAMPFYRPRRLLSARGRRKRA